MNKWSSIETPGITSLCTVKVVHYAHFHTHIYTYIHIYTYTHMHMHMHMHSSQLGSRYMGDAWPSASQLISCNWFVCPWHLSSSGYPMIIYTHSVANYLAIKTLGIANTYTYTPNPTPNTPLCQSPFWLVFYCTSWVEQSVLPVPFSSSLAPPPDAVSVSIHTPVHASCPKPPMPWERGERERGREGGGRREREEGERELEN